MRIRTALLLGSAVLSLIVIVTPASATVVLDPCILLDCPTITSAPAAESNEPSPAFVYRYTPSGLWGFKCQLDGAAAVGCGGLGLDTGPYSLAFGQVGADTDIFPAYTIGPLDAGPHTLQITGIEQAVENCQVTPIATFCDHVPGATTAKRTYSWYLDLTDPEASFSAGTADGAELADFSANYSFTVSDDHGTASARCSLDGVTPKPCTSPYLPGVVTPGKHTIAIYPWDSATNVGVPIERDFTYVPPPEPAVPLTTTPVGSASPGAAAPASAKKKKCARYKKTKLKRHGKVVRDKKGRIRYKRKCVKYKYV
jgi:hypothetical protein